MMLRDPTRLDYFRLVREYARLETVSCSVTLNVALLADFASTQFRKLLEVMFAENGIRLNVYESEFDTIEQEIFDPQSGFNAFKADIILLCQSTNSLRYKYFEEPVDTRHDWGCRVSERMAVLWAAIGERSKAYIVQMNYAMPYERQFGNFDLKVASSLYAQIAQLNLCVAVLSRQHSAVLINDIEAISSSVGRNTWCDERMWVMAKTLCALEYLPLVARSTVDIVLSTLGRGVKCLVLDLDNTLWGGVIGDDGIDGIAIGPFGEGEPFYRFQLYLRELKRRGLILCVCSKNTHEVAIRVFREHPEMVLREEDIAVFVANWDSKVDNIKIIHETLNIGFDSMVFLDDNIFERNMVRQYLPDVLVPELPEEPSDYVHAIVKLNLFETTGFTAEDNQRTKLYQEESKRKVLEKSYTNVGDYLQSLEMKLVIAPFDEFHVPRIAQLIQRSNQFNLTTNRLGVGECSALMRAGDSVVPLYAKLSDKFGDYGLISVVIVEFAAAHAEITTWLMSCRVLARGVEDHVMNVVVDLVKSRGLSRVIGHYIPTAKNGMVKDFYGRFGFHQSVPQSTGAIAWTLDISTYKRRVTHISDKKEETRCAKS